MEMEIMLVFYSGFSFQRKELQTCLITPTQGKKISLDQLQHDIKYGRHSESVNLLSQSRHLAEKAPEDRPKLNDTGWGVLECFQIFQSDFGC